MCGGDAGWFSADSRHFVVDWLEGYSKNYKSIDGKGVELPNEARLNVLGSYAEFVGVGAINLTTLNYIVLYFSGDSSDSWSLGYFIGDTYVKLGDWEGAKDLSSHISDDGKTVVVTNGKKLYINGEVRYTSSVDRLDWFLLSPDGTEIFVYGHGILTEDQLCPGRFFGKDLARAAPEGSVKYKDGAVVVTTW